MSHKRRLLLVVIVVLYVVLLGQFIVTNLTRQLAPQPLPSYIIYNSCGNQNWGCTNDCADYAPDTTSKNDKSVVHLIKNLEFPYANTQITSTGCGSYVEMQGKSHAQIFDWLYIGAVTAIFGALFITVLRVGAVRKRPRAKTF